MDDNEKRERFSGYDNIGKSVGEVMTMKTDALEVLTRTPHIRAYLAVMDPKALEQAETALGLPAILRGAMNGPLPDLRDTQVVLDALALYLREFDKAESVENMAKIRQAERARTMKHRIELGLTPLVCREAKINAEEAVREARRGRQR